ncbi:O-antigen ligase family protein [Clostridium disporicum]|uniref:Lipid A core-O-antigen ligase and related enzymes n=1 Tax=Clostridium disporicum TaxID=84024 RepID=A0A174F6Y5_9CLOT|nr:hypothetical protein [Clostridium disporicum]CUO43905.1 Lipid A core-O-antigen ligase and related enzymes [Clostridium disporicum]
MKSKEKLLAIIISILLFLMMFAPANLMRVKIAITIVLFFISLYYVFLKRYEIKINKKVFWWFVIYIGMSIVSMSISFINGNPGATNFLVVNIIGPCIFFAFIMSVSNSIYYNLINKIIIYTTIIIGVYNLVYFFIINDIFPFINPEIFPFIKANVGGINLGFTKITTENLSYLMFLFPYVFTLFFIEENKKIKNIALTASLLSILSAIISARTIFLLIIGISPILVILYGYLGNIPNCKIIAKRVLAICIIGTLLLAILLSIMKIDISKIADKIVSSFRVEQVADENGNIDPGAKIRVEQLEDLIYTWKQKPILGWGDGANALNVIRSDVEGMYELSYFALLMQRGIIGLIIYASQFFWIIIIAIRIIKIDKKNRNDMYCSLVGLTCMLIANATNPYLYSFDRLFIIFYPLLIINKSYLFLESEDELYSIKTIYKLLGK